MRVMNEVDFDPIGYFQVFSIDQNNQVVELLIQEKAPCLLKNKFDFSKQTSYRFDYFEDLNFLN